MDVRHESTPLFVARRDELHRRVAKREKEVLVLLAGDSVDAFNAFLFETLDE